MAFEIHSENAAKTAINCDGEIALPPFLREKIGDRCIRLRIAGRSDGPAVLALGGISADRFVAAEPDRKGWWADIARPGGGIDPDCYAVIGADYFPLTPSRPVDLAPEDYADAFSFALRSAGVRRLHAIVGASFGGMIALSLARRHPDFVGRIAVICAAHRSSLMSAALRLIQRRIVAFGVEAGAPADGVALARQLAMTTYRTAEEFDARFGGAEDAGDYLEQRGRVWSARMSAARFLSLSAAMDRQDERPEDIHTPALIVGASSDRLVPLADVRELAARLSGPVRLAEIDSIYGHDAFLKESARLSPILNDFMKEVF